AAHRFQRIRTRLRAGFHLVRRQVRAVRPAPDLRACGNADDLHLRLRAARGVEVRTASRRVVHHGPAFGGRRSGESLDEHREAPPVTGATLAPGVAALWLFGSFFALLVLRVPVAFSLGLACLPVLFIEPRLSPMVVFNTTFKAYNSFILLAVPFFLLTANLMNVGGITDRLVRLSPAMVGNFPGALAQINVLLSVFFAGISGSSTADAASQ